MYLERLSDALSNAVADGSIGIPRFIRWLDRVRSEDSIDDSLSFGAEICNRIFGSEPVRMHRSGDGELHGTIHAVWANGSSALVSVGPAGVGASARPEIMLLGSSGAMYFDGAQGGAATVEQVGRG